MAKVALGKKVPAFTAEGTGGKVKLRELEGNPVVLYFYPRDMTPGCTTEGEDFRDRYRKFRSKKATILGVSRDTLASHEKFKTKYKFQFDLLADTDEKLCKLFDVIKEKNMYGKKVLGIERSTFLIDAKGILRQEWRKVKVKGHAEEVLEALRAL